MTAERPTFVDVKAALNAGEGARAFNLLCRAVVSNDDFVAQAQAAKLYRAISPEALGLRPLKLALVASSTVDHLAQVLPLWLAQAGIAAEIYVASFDTVVQTVLQEDGDLYAFKPDVVWLFASHRDIHFEIAAGASVASVRDAVSHAVRQWSELWQVLLQRLGCIVIQNNADCPACDAFGNFAGTAAWGSRSALRCYNFELGAAAPAGVVIYDIDHVASLYGRQRWCDDRLWFHSKHAFAPDAIGLVASSVSRLIAAAKGMAKKCLVMDLDDTLWGGVVGDDGLEGIDLGLTAGGEAFLAFQEYARALKERGIILAICSKNNEEIAREVFERHPAMKLRLDDISVFRANWNEKVDNLREIAATLNLGLDALVFVDDNPVEREIVRQFLPAAVPEMPEDPAEFVPALASHGYFETVSLSDEDRARTSYYRMDAERAQFQSAFKDMAQYLSSLRMVGEVCPLDAMHLPRIAQLINKTNQFHLTGTRHTETALTAMAAMAEYEILGFKLRDRFGDNGLISAVVLREAAGELHIDTWAMSCRVLGRSMEQFICNEMLRVCERRGCHALIGHYRPSPKNKLVAGLYEKLGFEKLSEVDGKTMWRRASRGELTTYVQQFATACGTPR